MEILDIELNPQNFYKQDYLYLLNNHNLKYFLQPID